MKIIYANDTHFFGDSKPHYPKSVLALPKFFAMLENVRGDIDLLIVGGDCVNRGSARIRELLLFREKLDNIGVPYQVIAGNHDIAPSREFAAFYPGMEDIEDCPLEETNFGRTFGVKAIRNAMDVQGIKLIYFSIRDDDPDGQIEWFERELAGRFCPCLVFCHYPLIQSRENGFCATWGYQRISGIRPRLIDLIRKYRDSVLLYFCGHQHINSRVSMGNTEQIVTGALGTGTCCYRLIEIKNNQIKVTTHKLPGIMPWLDDAMNPDNSYDINHHGLETYHWGNREERDFTVAIKP